MDWDCPLNTQPSPVGGNGGTCLPNFRKKHVLGVFSGFWLPFWCFNYFLASLPPRKPKFIDLQEEILSVSKCKSPENLPGSRSRWWRYSWWACPPKFCCPRKWPPFGCALTSALEDLQHKKIIDIIFWDGTNFA